MIRAALPVIGTVTWTTAATRGSVPLLIDTHAGPYLWGDGVYGSPHYLATERREVQRRLVVCEIDPDRRASLEQHMARCGWEHKVYDDYREVLGRASRWRRGRVPAPFGLINVDPTGATDFEHELIVEALDSPYLQRMDVLLHGSETAHARLHGVNHEAATWREKIAAFEAVGFEFATFEFPQDVGQDAAWRWRLAFGTRYVPSRFLRSTYLEEVRAAALGAGLIERPALFEI